MNTALRQELTSLENMTVGQLLERYAEMFGETTNSRHKRYLIRRIAWRLQARAMGGLSERARKRAFELADIADVRVTPPKQKSKQEILTATIDRDPRLPAPGNWIERKYKGQSIRVYVDADAFEFDSQRYNSLSAVARAVTGSHCNGFRFFKLGAR